MQNSNDCLFQILICNNFIRKYYMQNSNDCLFQILICSATMKDATATDLRQAL